MRIHTRGLGAEDILVNVDAITLESGEHVVDLFRRVHLGRKDIVHLVVEQVAAFLAHVDEVADLATLLFNHQQQRFLPLSGH